MRRRAKAAIVVVALVPIVAAAVSVVLPMVSTEYRAKALARQLSSSNEEAVSRASRELVAMGSKAAPVVLRVFRDAARSKTQPGPWEWLQERLSRNDDADVPLYAASVLLSIGDPASDELDQALGDPDESVRWHMMDALERFRDDAVARSAWVRALSNPFDNVRWSAALTLGFARDPRATGVLMNEVRSDNARRRWTAALLLQIIGTPEARAVVDDVVARYRTGEIAANYREGIAAGDQADVPLLIFCLERYGTEEMALDYYRSREAELEHAADAWARRHGKTLPETLGDEPAVVWGAAKRQ